MKSSAIISKHTPKVIRSGIDVNQSSMKLNIKVVKNGEEILNVPGKSLLRPFLGLLSKQFTASGWKDTTPFAETSQFPNSRLSFLDNHVTLVTAATSLPVEPGLPVNFHTLNAFLGGNEVEIGHTTNANNQFMIRHARELCICGSDHAGNYKVIDAVADGTTKTIVTLEGLSALASDDVSGAYRLVIGNASNANRNNQTDDFFIIGFHCGNSSQPVKINDVFLPGYHETSVITKSGISRGTPVIAEGQSRIPISQTFTNVSGENQSVSELMLVARNQVNNGAATDAIVARTGGVVQSYGTQAIPMARDVVPSFVVAAGESFSVIYEFIAEISPEATPKQGVMANFNELMYRHFALTARSTRDMFNTSYSHSNTSGTFRVRGDGNPAFGVDYTYSGIQLGTHTGVIDIDNFTLQDNEGDVTRISNGKGVNQLTYQGTNILPSITVSANKAILRCVAFFINESDASVPVNEVGFSVMTMISNSRYPVLMSRNILDEADRVTLAPGEVLKVVYDISISTGS